MDRSDWLVAHLMFHGLGDLDRMDDKCLGVATIERGYMGLSCLAETVAVMWPKKGVKVLNVLGIVVLERVDLSSLCFEHSLGASILISTWLHHPPRISFGPHPHVYTPVHLPMLEKSPWRGKAPLTA